jgi:hypothetical protein
MNSSSGGNSDYVEDIDEDVGGGGKGKGKEKAYEVDFEVLRNDDLKKEQQKEIDQISGMIGIQVSKTNSRESDQRASKLGKNLNFWFVRL